MPLKTKSSIHILLLWLALLGNVPTNAQPYFKVLEWGDLFFNHKVDHFPNGDVLIGDSSLESLSNGGTDGKVFFSRRDPCGNAIWSHSYILSTGHLELKDFEINAAGDAFAYGSYYEGLDELIFVLKIDGNTGVSGDFKLFDPGSVDHFTYSLDIRGNRIMAFGLLFDFNSAKEGFVVVFNEALVVQWAKKFTPFESIGAAIITSDMGFLGRSGDYLMKMDPEGEPEWANFLETDPNIHAIAGPVEVADGYILEAHGEGFSFFYKVDQNGALVWQSERFPAADFGAAMTALPDGGILCTYSCSIDENNRLCQLLLQSDGTIANQRYLEIGSALSNGKVYQSIDAEQNIVIAANVDPFAAASAEISDYILQFSLENIPTSCFSWEGYRETSPNSAGLEFSYYDFDPFPFNMQLLQSVRTDTFSYSFSLREICGEEIDPDVLQQDTLLPCSEDWTVSLPEPNFVWLDGTPGLTRVISTPGTYQARSRSCTDPVVIDYTLEKEACQCQVYVPTAFSPNDDGINDQLEVFSDCALDEVEVSVFSRWGDRIFHSTTPGKWWDGRVGRKHLPVGVYVVVVTYRWTDSDGSIQDGRLAQDVTLVY